MAIAKFKSAWVITSSKIVNQNSKSICTSSYQRRKSTKFQVNAKKDVGGVAETRSLGLTAGWMEGYMKGWMDRIMHTQMDEGHFYSPSMPTSGDNKPQNSNTFETLGTILKPYCTQNSQNSIEFWLF